MLYRHYIESEETPEIYIWRTDESVEEMLSMFPVAERELYREEIRQFRHDKRKLEFLCARHLLRIAVDDGHRVMYEDSGRPYLSTLSKEMNISHTKDYVAIAMHHNRRVALDIETRGVKVERVMRKFLTEEEMSYLSENQEERLLQLHIMWCAKETMYKIMSHRDIEFDAHLHIERFEVSDESGELKCWESRTDELMTFRLKYRVFEDFVMVSGMMGKEAAKQ